MKREQPLFITFYVSRFNTMFWGNYSGRDPKLDMKKFIVTFMGCVFFVISLHAEEQQIRQLLQSEDWRERDKAVHIILKDFEKYQNNDVLKQEVLEALSMENEKLRAQEDGRVFQGEGSGETYLDLLSLVIKLDISNSTEVLLDSVGHGGIVNNALVDRLLKEGGEDLTILQVLRERVESSDIFYKGIKSSYFRIIRKYLEKAPVINEEKKRIVKEIVFNGMLLPDHIAKRNAIQCSQYFPELIPEVLPKLIERATTETDRYVRRVSVEALGEIGDPIALPVLQEVLNDKEPEVRKAAVYAFAKFQTPSVIPFLTEALNDPAGMVRGQAAWQLGRIGATTAIPHLKKLATDDPYLREIDAAEANTYGFDEQHGEKYFIYRVRRAAKAALEAIERQSATDTIPPSPASTEEPLIKTVVPSPESAEKSSVQPEQQVSPESDPLPPATDFKKVGILILIVLLVLCVIGYWLYRMKLHKK